MISTTKEKIYLVIMIILTLLFLKNIIVNLTHRQLSVPEEIQGQYKNNTINNCRQNNLFTVVF